MAYIKNGYMNLKAGTLELTIDEFDEDAVDIESEVDKTSIRYTTKGKAVYSIRPNVPYRLTMAIPPHSKTMSRVINFLDALKNKDYPDITFTTYEKIDGQVKVTSYEDGNIAQDLFYESIMKDDAPAGTFQVVGTRIREAFE